MKENIGTPPSLVRSRSRSLEDPNSRGGRDWIPLNGASRRGISPDRYPFPVYPVAPRSEVGCVGRERKIYRMERERFAPGTTRLGFLFTTRRGATRHEWRRGTRKVGKDWKAGWTGTTAIVVWYFALELLVTGNDIGYCLCSSTFHIHDRTNGIQPRSYPVETLRGINPSFVAGFMELFRLNGELSVVESM